ncbi:hypothetical protein QUB37_18595 [Microcoleus sp. AT3-A2]
MSSCYCEQGLRAKTKETEFLPGAKAATKSFRPSNLFMRPEIVKILCK